MQFPITHFLKGAACVPVKYICCVAIVCDGPQQKNTYLTQRQVPVHINLQNATKNYKKSYTACSKFCEKL